MLKVFLLVWTLVLPDGSNQTIVQQTPSLDACQTMGVQTAKESQMMVDGKQLKDFFGTCQEVWIDTKAGSI